MDEPGEIANLAQLAAVLEVSTEKPGNVSPSHDFSDTTYEDFLFGSVGVGIASGHSAVRGFMAGEGKISLGDIGLGNLIREGVSHIKRSHAGGNTHLGTLMLLTPLAASAGLCISRRCPLEKGLRKHLMEIIGNSSIEDSIDFYEAVRLADAGGLSKPMETPRIPFHDLMRVSSRVDRVADELAEGMKTTFDLSVPALDRTLQGTGSIRKAILQTYLILLSGFPDSLIAKKAGAAKSQRISIKATEALDLGGVFTKAGMAAIERLDQTLREEDNKLNPGTTADLTAAAVFIWLLFNRL